MEILGDIQAGRIELVGKDTREPSPFSHQLVNSNVYTFLDDAPLEERRARAVAVRRSFRADDVRDLGRLDPEAIARVKAEASPFVRNADELHDLLLSTGALPEAECRDWMDLLADLERQRRVVRREVVNGTTFWIAAERWAIVSSALSLTTNELPSGLPEGLRESVDHGEACLFMVRGRLEIVGPTTALQFAAGLALSEQEVQIALEQLELAGFVLRGHFNPGSKELEWCERRLLAPFIVKRLTDCANKLRRLIHSHLFAFCSYGTGSKVAGRHAVAI